MAVQRLGDVAVGTIVKLSESGDLAEFIVIHQGLPSSGNYDSSCDGVWLRRKDAHSNRAFGSSSDYANSSLHKWLNNASNGYLSKLDPDIQDAIIPVKIPYFPGSDSSAGNVQSGADGLDCKIFILSLTEVGLSSSSTKAIGAKLDYFNGTYVDAKTARTIYLNGVIGYAWTRSPTVSTSGYSQYPFAFTSNQSGTPLSTEANYIAPSFILPKNLYVLEDGTIVISQPPTAPGGINVSGVVRGGSATITLTEATDPDGTVESYIYERQVDGGAWEQVAQANSLTQTDAIGEEWGTVAYRACAVDDKGVSGPYVTSETFTVNSGWTIISGPAESMGSKPAPFDFAFSVSVTGEPDADAITVSAALDGVQVYSGTPNTGEQVTIPIKTHLLGAGTHTIEVQASKDDYLPASKRYTFTVPAVTIPDGGVGAMAQGPDGRAVYHTTLAQRCIGRDGVDIQAQMDALAARVKTLEG